MKTTPRMPTPLRTGRQSSELPVEVQERIRHRAYELYEQRGKMGGHDLDDWLQAELELTQKKTKAVAA